MSLQIASPFQQFFDRDGSPLDNGFVYVGTANLNPETNPLTVYFDDALTIPAAQPLRTSNGYIVRNGSPARVYTSQEDFSMTVRDKNSVLVFTVSDATSLSDLRTDLALPTGATLVGYGAGTVADALDDLTPLLNADIFVNAVSDLSGLTYSDAPAGKTVYAKTENLLFEVLASGATNAPYDFTDTGGVKLTFVDDVKQYFSAGVKETAINEQEAINMAADISEMAGYAAYAATTGGSGYSTYWVRNAYTTNTEGSLLWAIAQATAAGGGIILFQPRGFFNINLTQQIEIPDNVTIDAPGRNARIWAPYDVTQFKVVGSNVIIRRLSFGATANPATAIERDALWIEPSLADRVWVDQCSFTWAGDGCIDIASLSELVADCRITVSKCQFSSHDKASLIGSLACYELTGRPAWCPTALDDQTIRLFVTMTGNYFHCVSQRQPKVVAQTFVDSVNNVIRMAPFKRDDGTTSACYGIFSAQGGCVRSRGDLFLAATGSGYAGVDASTNSYVPPSPGVLTIEGQGACEVVGSVAANSITMTDRETSYIPTPPYTITPASITDTPAGRRDFLEQIQANAGASADNVPEGMFRWDGSSSLHPNTFTQISETNGDGRWLRIDRWNATPDYPEAITEDQPVIYPLGSNLIVASAEITVPSTGAYFSVDTEGAAATDDLETINGGVDGRMIILRSYLTAQVVTIKHDIGNIRMAGGDFTFTSTTNRITLMYDASLSKWYEISRA
jgi:pectate lyase